MAYETLLVETRGAVTLVTLNRPQALNALNNQVLQELLQAFAAFDADPSQHCAVLTGSEKAFAAGADIKEMQPQGVGDMFGDNYFAGYELLTRTRKPVIAAVSGYALGGGCELRRESAVLVVAPAPQGVRACGGPAVVFRQVVGRVPGVLVQQGELVVHP